MTALRLSVFCIQKLSRLHSPSAQSVSQQVQLTQQAAMASNQRPLSMTYGGRTERASSLALLLFHLYLFLHYSALPIFIKKGHFHTVLEGGTWLIRPQLPSSGLQPALGFWAAGGGRGGLPLDSLASPRHDPHCQSGAGGGRGRAGASAKSCEGRGGQGLANTPTSTAHG